MAGRTPLHTAAELGDEEEVRKLLEDRRYDVNCVDELGWTPLHKAASKGHLGVVRVLVKADVNAHDKCGDTPLHMAAGRGHLDVVRVLVKADVNAHDKCGDTPLHKAASEGHLDVVRVLASEFKADVNARDKYDDTPLHYAAGRGHLDVVRVLASEFKADVNARDGDGDTPLHKAAGRGHLDVVRVLASEFKADVNVHGEYDDTPLHKAAGRGHLDVVRVLASEFKADVNACDGDGDTPLHYAAGGGHLDVVRVLASEFKADVNACDGDGDTPLHYAAGRGHLDVVRVLVKADVNAHDKCGDTPLHKAASEGHLDVVRVLASEFKADVNARDKYDDTPLHKAASEGHLDVVRVLASEFKADVNARDKYDDTPLHYAAGRGHLDVVRVLASEFKADVNVHGEYDDTPLHKAAGRGHLDVVRVLASEFKADVNACDGDGDTPLHYAAGGGHLDVVRVLASEFKADVNACDGDGDTPLHYAAGGGHLDVVRVLASEFKADVNACDGDGDTPLHRAAGRGHLDVVRVLVKADVNAHDKCGDTPLHKAASEGHLDVVRVLASEFKADVNARDKYDDTPLHKAASEGHLDVVRVLASEFKADVNARDKYDDTPLHYAAGRGHLDVVRVLASEFKADVNARDGDGDTPLHYAAGGGHLDVVRVLASEFKADVNARDGDGDTPLHYAAGGGHLDVVRVLASEFKADVNARDGDGDTPLHRAAGRGHLDVVRVLASEFKADVNARDGDGDTPLHRAAGRGHLDVVRVLASEFKADVNARDGDGNTPLHVAAMNRREDVVVALIAEFGCDVHAKGHMGRSLLHSACASYNCRLVSLVSKHISPLVLDDNGDTPLHICARLGSSDCVKALLELDPPVLLRNNSGKTPKDVAKYESYKCIDDYMRENKGKIYSHYEVILKHAKKKYSLAEPITRAFAIGKPGAGKSSLVEALKREGFVDSFKRVSESSVPLHTAGIIPSIHSSKHYGRVLFYDFAGDAEYYSSHAAILENLASSRKGDNVFILVIDMREEMAEIKIIFNYWLSFIQHQQFCGQKPHLIVVGSHLDLLTGDVARARGKEFEKFCDSIDTAAVQMLAYFMLDCCKPRSKQITEIQTLMRRLVKDSPRFKLSLKDSVLLGLLEKDFSNVPACSIQALLDHIEETGIQLPTDAQSLYPILSELHDLGLLFLIESSYRENSSLVLNMSQLTNIVHKSLFAEQADLKACFEEEGLTFSFSAGIIPLSILAKILPENITKECLVQLQYCQEISHAEAHVFPSLKVSDSTDQSFLFFPALCSADKSEVEWVTPPDFSYGIGWLARCTDPCDYLSPRFHHVLMLRLVFKFTLSTPHTPADQVSSGSHFQRRCTVWKTGVHWLMEEGVECMVELASANKEVVVLTRSTNDLAENCATVFNGIVSCVMEAKAEFCHSVRLEFFLLDSTSEADYHSAHNLFAMRDVERVLTSAEGRAEVIVSATGKRKMRRSKLLCLRNFTLWSSLFPMEFKSVLNYIKDVVRELYMLGLYLGIPKGILDAIEADNRGDVGKMRRELVMGWMSSSPDPPCWWHLINGLRDVQCGVLAEEIATGFGKWRIYLLLFLVLPPVFLCSSSC